eukprot:CAMPEP_0185597156 /NCGR_PEP_ID=MMETSP0434-20130131/81186_1 /TAXON_ID=626734 ORGANISM="Favella taraikaensis, Strain Fe Narragansett Bay" /NCGR_SAMPLE_ID=MMETSP0434 /ASSEMBLY_ACC=CAM_ASM_000379 /LENGTH=44 /DNA_ID= /DNA_START= /DNA_END= /DNA_ORIENTATION=
MSNLTCGDGFFLYNDPENKILSWKIYTDEDNTDYFEQEKIVIED